MGIFTRFRDIISSNINAMLDRAEDPEKMVRMMIREMEDTLVEIKASCAGAMASSKRVQRQLDAAGDRARYWGEKAELAVAKGRDDLAREALVEKRRFQHHVEGLKHELSEHNALVAQYQEDIQQLEDKLKQIKEKQRVLVQRHIHARRKKRAQEELRRVDSTEAIRRFDELETRIDRMEAEADLVNIVRPSSLEEQLDRLSVDEEIEQQLQDLKSPTMVAEKK